MKKIDQIYYKGMQGDCLRAAVASMLELPVEVVPHFMLLHGSKYNWTDLYVNFFKSLGYRYEYVPVRDRNNRFYRKRLPTQKNLINKCILATIHSKVIKNSFHAVLINSTGRIIHDPHPKKLYLGENVFTNKSIVGWDKLTKVD